MISQSDLHVHGKLKVEVTLFTSWLVNKTGWVHPTSSCLDALQSELNINTSCDHTGTSMDCFDNWCIWLFLAWVALSCINDGLAIYKNCCDTVVLGWVRIKSSLMAHHNAKSLWWWRWQDDRKFASGEKVASLQHSSVRLKQFSLSSRAAGLSWWLLALLIVLYCIVLVATMTLPIVIWVTTVMTMHHNHSWIDQPS